MNYMQFFHNILTQFQNDGRYRTFVPLERCMHQSPRAIWHHRGQQEEITVWCSNDYLGMSHHPDVITASQAAIGTYGVGSGGTRNISGTSYPHVLLEETLAQFHQKQAALLFSSGYVANEATLAALGKHLPECLIFSDEKNHASIIAGIQQSRAAKVVFRHNDMADLESHLKQCPIERPKLIVMTSVYSMDGDYAPLEEAAKLAKVYNALLYVDEVHAVGLYGPTGAGRCEALGITNQIDIIQGNFAKGLGGVGGYIAGDHVLVDFIRSVASGFIFTTSLPPATAVAARTAIQVIQTDTELRTQFWRNVMQLKETLKKTFLPFKETPSHIVPIIIGCAKRCKEICDQLLYEDKIYAQPINYPTVPIGQECLRLTITPFHTSDDIMHLVHALERAILSPSIRQVG